MKELLYSWKGAEYKVLRSYPESYIDYELSKLQELYGYEYKFKLN